MENKIHVPSSKAPTSWKNITYSNHQDVVVKSSIRSSGALAKIGFWMPPAHIGSLDRLGDWDLDLDLIGG
jgi:hypothetical protein